MHASAMTLKLASGACRSCWRCFICTNCPLWFVAPEWLAWISPCNVVIVLTSSLSTGYSFSNGQSETKTDGTSTTASVQVPLTPELKKCAKINVITRKASAKGASSKLASLVPTPTECASLGSPYLLCSWGKLASDVISV